VERLRTLYQKAGAVVLTLLLLWLAAQPFLPREDGIFSQGSAMVEARYGMDRLQQVYQGRSAQEIRALLRETWDRGFRYRPYLQFREAELQGKYVNVSPHGYRIHDSSAPWPPEPTSVNVFAFGGSNTFGYGLSDRETWPCALEVELRSLSGRPVRVYNFGCGYYYSTQEVLLLELLLLEGIKPDMAIFLDGLNDAHPFTADDTPRFTDELGKTFHPGAIPQRQSVPWNAEAMWDRLRRNRLWAQRLGRDHGVTTVFAIQPIPSFAFSGAHYPFSEWANTSQLQLAQAAYQNAPRAEVLWLAEVGRQVDFPAYLDAVHYSPRMSALVAAEMADALLPLLPKAQGLPLK
jgi:lysophospholipase L1-like esterase